MKRFSLININIIKRVTY